MRTTDRAQILARKGATNTIRSRGNVLKRSKCFSCAKTGSDCDSQRPFCSQCLRADQRCPGYKTKLTWVDGLASRGSLRGVRGVPEDFAEYFSAFSTSTIQAELELPAGYSIHNSRNRSIAPQKLDLFSSKQKVPCKMSHSTIMAPLDPITTSVSRVGSTSLLCFTTGYYCPRCFAEVNTHMAGPDLTYTPVVVPLATNQHVLPPVGECRFTASEMMYTFPF